MNNKTFSPKKYLNNQINAQNCHHELLTISGHNEGLYGCNYMCLICGQYLYYPYHKSPDKSKYIFTDLGLEDNSVIFLQMMINYIAKYHIKEKEIDIAEIFTDLESYINVNGLSFYLTATKIDNEKQKIKTKTRI